MLAILIEDLELYLNNKNLLLGKNAIQFEPHTQKSKNIQYFVLFSYYKSQTLTDVGVYAQL